MTYDDRRDVFNIRLANNCVKSGTYGFPNIKANTEIQNIDKIISFNYHNQIRNRQNYYVHFYIDDYQFERVWNCPSKYIPILKQFKGVIAPDFSVYTNMPKAQQIFQIYKQRLITATLQNEGVNVIPNVVWSDFKSLDWALENFPTNSVVALSSNGCLNKNVKNEFIRCYNKAMDIIKPIQVIFIGSIPEELKADKRIYEIKSRVDYLHNLNKRSNI